MKRRRKPQKRRLDPPVTGSPILIIDAKERKIDFRLRHLHHSAPAPGAKTAQRIPEDGTEYDGPLESFVDDDKLSVRPGNRGPLKCAKPTAENEISIKGVGHQMVAKRK